MRSAYRLMTPLLVTLLAITTACAQPALSVKLVSVTSPIRHGADATIVVATAPKAACTITVIYKSGPSRAQGLIPETADARGRVAWTWRVGTRTTPGTWPIVVNCSSGARSGKLQTSFDVI